MYKDVLQLRAYRWNLIAAMIGRLGDSIDMIGFSWMMYGLTRSPFYTAIVFGINMLPTLFLQPFAGAMIERLSKKKIIVLCDILRSLLTMVVLVLYIAKHLDPVFLLLVTFLNNGFEAFRMPAGTCFLAGTLPKEKYEQGLSLYQSASRTCELIGTGLAGLLLSSYGIGLTLLIDGLAFGLSAILISQIHLVERTVDQILSLKESCIQLKEGFSYLIKNRSLFMISIMAALINAGLVPFNSFESAYIRDSMHGSALLLSGVSFCISFGAIIGSLLYPVFRKVLSNEWLLFVCGMLIGGYNLLLAGLPSIDLEVGKILLLVMGSLIIGMGAGCGSVLVSSRVMVHAEKEYLARISSIFNAISCALVPILSLSIAFISKTANILSIFFIFGFVFIALFILLFRRSV